MGDDSRAGDTQPSIGYYFVCLTCATVAGRSYRPTRSRGPRRCWRRR